jgi:hypothetical protein
MKSGQLRASHVVRSLIILLIALIALSLTSAQAKAQTMGIHGMAVFGDESGWFAAHLPMFHAPHDYQVLLAVEFADPKTEQSFRQLLKHKPELWSLEPAAFELAQLWQTKNPRVGFDAKLYQGHFERGGQLKFANQAIRVKQLLFWQQLNPTQRLASQAHYRIVTSAKHRYAIKTLDQRPDFDHIVRIESGKFPNGSVLTVSTPTFKDPKRPDQILLDAAFAKQSLRVQTIYLDSLDLQ